MAEQAPPAPATNPDELADLAIGALGPVPGEPGGATEDEFNARADAVFDRVMHSEELATALDARMRQLAEAEASGPLTDTQRLQQKAILGLQARAQAAAQRREAAKADADAGEPDNSMPEPDGQQGAGAAEAHHRKRQRRQRAAAASGASAMAGAAAGSPAASGRAPGAAKPGPGTAQAQHRQRQARGAGAGTTTGPRPTPPARGRQPNKGVQGSGGNKNLPPARANQAPRKQERNIGETLPSEIGVLRQIEGELDNAALSFDRLKKIKDLVDASVQNVGGNWVHVSGSRFRVRDSRRETGLYQDTNDGRDSINKLVARVIEKSRFEYHLLQGDSRRDVEEIMDAERLDFSLTSVADEPGRRTAAADRAWHGGAFDYRAPVGAGERSVNSAISAEVTAAVADVQAMRTDRSNSRRLHGVVPHSLRHRGFRPAPEAIRTEERDPESGALIRYLSRDEIVAQMTAGERRHFEKQEAFHRQNLRRVAGEAQHAAHANDTQDRWRGNLSSRLREQVMAEYRAAGHTVGEAKITSEAQRATMLRWAQMKSMAKMELHNQIYGMKLAQLAGRPNTGLDTVSITGMTRFDAATYPVLRTMRAVSRARYGRRQDANASLNYALALQAESVARSFLIQAGLDEGVVIPHGETPAQRTQRHERRRRFITERDALRAAAGQRVDDYVGGRKINSHVNGMWVDESIRGSMPRWFVQRLEGDAGRLAPAGVLRTPFKADTPLEGGGKLEERGDGVFYSRI